MDDDNKRVNKMKSFNKLLKEAFIFSIHLVLTTVMIIQIYEHHLLKKKIEKHLLSFKIKITTKS